MELFGKKFKEVKYWMYEKGNEDAKNKFFNKLFATTGKSPRATDRESYASNFDQPKYSRGGETS